MILRWIGQMETVSSPPLSNNPNDRNKGPSESKAQWHQSLKLNDSKSR